MSNNVHSRYTIVRRGKLVTFYRNGDPYYKGLQTSVSGKHFVTLSTLLSWLNDKIPVAAGVQYIFRLPDGFEITDVTQFVAGKSYAVSSTRKLNTSIQYGDVSRKCHTHGDDGRFEEDVSNLLPEKNFGRKPGASVSPSRQKVPQHHLSEPNFDFDSKPQTNHTDANSRQQILDNLNKLYNKIDPADNIAGDVEPKPNFFNNDFAPEQQKENRLKHFNDDFKSSLDATNSDDDKYQNPPRYSLPRSEPRSFQSSAESSNSGSDKLSRFEQPRNKTFLPVDESDQDILPEEKKIKGKDGGNRYERSSRQQRPYKNSDLRTSRKSDSLPRLDTYRQSGLNNHEEWDHKKINENIPITASYSVNPEVNPMHNSKLWSPMSLQNNVNKNLYNHKKAKPRIIQIISNTVRKSQQRVIFNPKTLQSFEEVLKDLENMVKLLYPPATALFTAEEPFVKVLSLTHLSRELGGCEEFLVCGREGIPLEIHPDYSRMYHPTKIRGAQNPNFLPPIKTFRSEDNIFPEGANNFDGKPVIRGRSRNSNPTPTNTTSSLMRPINIYLNEKPKNNKVVACDGTNCNCRLHETISKLIKSDHVDSVNYN